MNISKVLSSAVVGTSAMSLFSYLVSQAKGENFREPEVLSSLIKRLDPEIPKPAALADGWIMHYGIGVAFAYLYDKLWSSGAVKPSVKSGVVLGAAAGIVGVGAWKVMFETHPNPPAKNLKRYFGHLLLAHLVFGAFSAVGYKTAKKE